MRSKMRALIIHSNERLRRELVKVLAGEGCQVLEAESHTQGLALLHQIKPELIFLHVTSDQEDGWDAFSQIRLLTNAPTILLANALPSSKYCVLCERNNAALFVQPFQIADVVAEAMRLRQSRLNPSPGADRRNDSGVARSLYAFHWMAIDRALQEIADGEVRLVVQRGRLRFLERIRTIQLDGEPVAT